MRARAKAHKGHWGNTKNATKSCKCGRLHLRYRIAAMCRDGKRRGSQQSTTTTNA